MPERITITDDTEVWSTTYKGETTHTEYPKFTVRIDGQYFTHSTWKEQAEKEAAEYIATHPDAYMEQESHTMTPEQQRLKDQITSAAATHERAKRALRNAATARQRSAGHYHTEKETPTMSTTPAEILVKVTQDAAQEACNLWQAQALTADEYDRAATTPGSEKHAYCTNQRDRWQHNANTSAANMELLAALMRRAGIEHSPAQMISTATRKAEEQRQAIREQVKKETRGMKEQSNTAPVSRFSK